MKQRLNQRKSLTKEIQAALKILEKHPDLSIYVADFRQWFLITATLSDIEGYISIDTSLPTKDVIHLITKAFGKIVCANKTIQPVNNCPSGVIAPSNNVFTYPPFKKKYGPQYVSIPHIIRMVDGKLCKPLQVK